MDGQSLQAIPGFTHGRLMGRVLCTLQIAVRHRFMWLFTRSPWGRAARQASSARFISGEAGGWYQDNAKMKLNIASSTGQQKKLEVDDDNKLRPFFDKRLSNEVEGDSLGDEFKGYVFKIMGGQDKEGFPMKQGVLTPGRVRLLMTPGDKCFRGYGRKNGERRRKTVRGCIVSNELAVLNLMIVKKGQDALPGLTDGEKAATRGPKRATRIRKLFNLTKEDDVRKYVTVYGRTKTSANGKTHRQNVKIQRLVTPERLQRKRRRAAIKKGRITKRKSEAADYHKLLMQRLKEQRERRSESLAKKRAVRMASQASKEAPQS